MSSIHTFHDKKLGDLSKPIVFEPLDYEQELNKRFALLNGYQPLLFNTEYQPVYAEVELVQTNTEAYFKLPFNGDIGMMYTTLESDPMVRLMQIDAYLAQLEQNQRNVDAVSVMPAFATFESLDYLADRDKVYRQVITEADNTVIPPIAAVLEDDESFRRRWFLSREAESAGGSEGWYLYHALSASPLIKDAMVFSPEPRGVNIIILSHEGNGTATALTIQKVKDYINSELSTLVMTDQLTVLSADVIEYRLEAKITYYPGASNNLVKELIQQEFIRYREKTERIAHGIKDTSFLNQPGVYQAEILTTLPEDIESHQAVYCTELVLTDGGEYGYV